jgi:ryanodine receptor 3
VFGERGEETEEGTETEEVTQVEEKAMEAGEKASREAPVKGLLQTRLPESVKLQVSWAAKLNLGNKGGKPGGEGGL